MVTALYMEVCNLVPTSAAVFLAVQIRCMPSQAVSSSRLEEAPGKTTSKLSLGYMCLKMSISVSSRGKSPIADIATVRFGVCGDMRSAIVSARSCWVSQIAYLS